MRDGRLRVFEGRSPEPTHNLVRTDLGDLWLQELHPVQQKSLRHRGTANILHRMARTHDHSELDLLCLRDKHLWHPRKQRMLGWLGERLGLCK